jgi:hypothetical protein
MVCLGRWTVEELRSVIVLLKRPEFNPAEIDDDLHKRIARAVHDKMIKSFDMRESSRDGDQDLTMFMREVEEVVREIMGDPNFKGNQSYKFEANWRRRETVMGGEASAGVAFQIGQIRYIHVI